MLWYIVIFARDCVLRAVFFCMLSLNLSFTSVPSSCTTGNVTLVDGDNEMEGRVEVCRDGVWGAVYDSVVLVTTHHILLVLV